MSSATSAPASAETTPMETSSAPTETLMVQGDDGKTSTISQKDLLGIGQDQLATLAFEYAKQNDALNSQISKLNNEHGSLKTEYEKLKEDVTFMKNNQAELAKQAIAEMIEGFADEEKKVVEEGLLKNDFSGKSLDSLMKESRAFVTVGANNKRLREENATLRKQLEGAKEKEKEKKPRFSSNPDISVTKNIPAAEENVSGAHKLLAKLMQQGGPPKQMTPAKSSYLQGKPF